MTETFTQYLNEVYVPRAIQNVVWNSWWMNQPHFEIVNGHGGAEINVLIDASTSTNAEIYSQGAPMPDPDTTTHVRAYFNKDTFQGTAKVYGDTQAQLLGANATNVPLAAQQKAIDVSLKNMIDLMSTTMIADLALHVDAGNTYSDAALVRATYALASIETGSVGALALTDLEDLLEGLQDVTNGFVDSSDLVWLMPRNQLTNLSRLTTLASNAPFNSDAQNPASIDAGRVMRTKFFEGIPIFVIPDMTTTEIYLVPKSETKIYVHDPIKTVEKDVAEYANAWLSTGGVNLVVQDPRRSGKLTGITA